MDTTPLESDLLRHRDFLLRLATGLVGGNDAEDLVQDVWAKALEHPREPGSGARGWLARVARNLAVNRFRARSRRQRREQDAARPEGASDSFEEVDERFELGQRVAAAVRALDEPHRAVILLRFFEGLGHAEIAARLELPIATVRTRQQRALARLRERLDREHGGREAWSAGLAGWVTRQGLTAPVAGAAAVLVAASAALVGLAGGAWWFVRAHGAEPPAAGVVAAAAQAPAVGGLRDDPPSQTGTQREALAGAAPHAPRHLVQGRVTGLTPEECAAAEVEVDAKWKHYAIDPPAVRAAVRADGSFEVAVDELMLFAHQWANPKPPDEFVVLVEHPLHLRTPVRVAFERGQRDAAGDTRFDAGALEARDAAVLHGRVLLPDGAPAVGASVAAFFLDAGVPREESVADSKCDAEGRFDLRVERGGDVATVALVEGVRPAQVLAAPRLGQVLDLGPLRLEPGHTLAGRVLRLGMPMPKARVSIWAADPGRSLHRVQGSQVSWIEGRVEWTSAHLEADDDGRFEYGGFAAREFELDAGGTGRMGSLSMRPEVTRVLAPSADLALEFRASLVTLDRTPESPAEVTGKIRVTRDGKEEAAFWFFRASDEPATTFVAPPNTPLSLSIELEGVPPIPLEIVTPGPGEELRRTIAFDPPGAPAALELEWVPPAKLAIDALRVYFASPDGAEKFDRGFYTEDSPDGRFLVEDVPPGRYRVRIHAGWDHLSYTPALDRVLELELRTGETAHERFEFELGGRFQIAAHAPSGELRRAQFRLLDAAGAQVPAVLHAHRDGTDMAVTWCLSPWSANESEALPLGDYELVLWDDDVGEQRVPVRLVAGETTDLAVTLQPK